MLLLPVQPLDFLVLFLNLGDLGFEVTIALVLAADLLAVVEPQQQRQHHASRSGQPKHRVELALPLFAPFGAPRQ